MRIVQIVPYFYPAWRYGGPAKLVFNLSRSLVAAGHQVVVLTTDVYSADQRMPIEVKLKSTSNLQVWYCRILNNVLADRVHLFMSVPFLIRAPLIIKDADCVHLHDFFTPLHVWSCWWARWWGRPYIINVHGTLESQAQAQKSLFKKVFLWLVGRDMLAHAAQVIASSRQEAERYKEQGVTADQITLLGHGVDPQEVATTINQTQARQQLHLPFRKVIFTFLGRFHRYKGLGELLEAVANVSQPNLHLVIAGADDGFLTEMRQRIATDGKLKRRVTLLGPQAGDAKAALFRASDVFVYPSYLEGFSMAILEAASAGLALLITPGCHFPLVSKLQAGLIVKPKPNELQKGITWLISHPTWRRQAGQRAKTMVEKSFSQSRITQQLCTMYEREVTTYANRTRY